MNINKLIERLIQATYDSGYEAGVGRSGLPSHGAAISRRNLAKRDLEAAIAEQQARLAKATAALEELANLVDAYLDGSYEFDSFSTQPARIALREE